MSHSSWWTQPNLVPEGFVADETPAAAVATDTLPKEAAIKSFFGEYRFLSNFYPVRIKMDGKVYPTLEHAYQASKTFYVHFREMIQQANTPGMAKHFGKTVPLREDWDNRRIPIMKNLLVQKFSIPTLRKKLLATGSRELIEGNNWRDTFWGVCKGIGENHLGKLLMEVRDEIRNNSLLVG